MGFPKHMNMPKEFVPSMTFCIKTRYDHHSYLRMYQSYRNMSRTSKQYFYGDEKVEALYLEYLRYLFHIPKKFRNPMSFIKTRWRKKNGRSVRQRFRACVSQ